MIPICRARAETTSRKCSARLKRSSQKMDYTFTPPRHLSSSASLVGEVLHHRGGDGGVRTSQHCDCGTGLADYFCGADFGTHCRNESSGETGLRRFAKHKKILLARTKPHSRLLAYTTLVRNAPLYAAETWPVHQRILRAANSTQTQHLQGMLFLNRQPTEQWAAWQSRTLRSALVHLQRNKIERWSSYILKWIWPLWGHMARGGVEVNSIVTWKNMQFWRAQQQLPCKQRVTHASRFNPEANVERAIEAVAGTHCGAFAQDRQKWQELSLVFLEKFDVPWATGKQLTLQASGQLTTPPPARPTHPRCNHSGMMDLPEKL